MCSGFGCLIFVMPVVLALCLIEGVILSRRRKK